jgi:hypothetical protein
MARGKFGGPHLKTSHSVATLSVFVLSAACCFAKPAGDQKAAIAEDRGRFEISVNGSKVGSEEFSVSKDGAGWVVKGTTELHSATGSAKVTGELHLSASGAPTRYDWSSDSGKKVSSNTTFEGSEAKMSTTIGGGKPIKQDFFFNPPVVILDNNLYHQYEVIARLYNWTARGPQNFSVLIPQEHMPGAITAEAAPAGAATGPAADQLHVHTSDLDLLLFLDSTHRLMRISVPTANAEIVRK